MLRILIVCAVLVAANACLFAMFWMLDRREEKRQAAERDAAELRRKLTAPHRPALSERLRAGPRYGYEYERINFAPRGLDPVTVDDGRVVRTEQGAA